MIRINLHFAREKILRYKGIKLIKNTQRSMSTIMKIMIFLTKNVKISIKQMDILKKLIKIYKIRNNNQDLLCIKLFINKISKNN